MQGFFDSKGCFFESKIEEQLDISAAQRSCLSTTRHISEKVKEALENTALSVHVAKAETAELGVPGRGQHHPGDQQRHDLGAALSGARGQGHRGPVITTLKRNIGYNEKLPPAGSGANAAGRPLANRFPCA